MYDEFFEKAHELTLAGRPFATATVVRAERPTSGRPGDRAIITLDGIMYGWIGGSCAQPTVIREAGRAILTNQSLLIRLSPDPGSSPLPEGYEEVAMTCFSGGTLDVYIEPQQPCPRLVVVGDLPVARSLIQLGKALNYRVVALASGDHAESVAAADDVLSDVTELGGFVTPFTFAVVATHGHDDEAALVALLDTSAPYIGLVASPKRGAAMLDGLRHQGVAEADLERISVPAGLDIQAREGDEIAVSILAEIIQVRRNLERLEWESHSSSVAQESTSAIDPVCQMTVDTATARHTFELDGQRYYFCCPGCRDRFEQNSGAYLGNAGAQATN